MSPCLMYLEEEQQQVRKDGTTTEDVELSKKLVLPQKENSTWEKSFDDL